MKSQYSIYKSDVFQDYSWVYFRSLFQDYIIISICNWTHKNVTGISGHGPPVFKPSNPKSPKHMENFQLRKLSNYGEWLEPFPLPYLSTRGYISICSIIIPLYYPYQLHLDPITIPSQSHDILLKIPWIYHSSLIPFKSHENPMKLPLFHSIYHYFPLFPYVSHHSAPDFRSSAPGSACFGLAVRLRLLA